MAHCDRLPAASPRLPSPTRRRASLGLALLAPMVLLAAGAVAPAQEPAVARPAAPPQDKAPLLGDAGKGHLWRWVPGWGERADGRALGSTHGCLCVDRQGRILVNTDTEAAVVIFTADGERVGEFGAEFKGGLHGMTLRVEDGQEFLYLAHTARHEVVKTTLAGEVLWTLGVPQESGIYEKEGDYKPTAVAVAPDGRLFAADGYGKSWVHLYDAERRYLKSIGGKGTEPGRFRTPHGLWLDTRGDEPLLLVCDRENHRLQWFTLDGDYVRHASDGLRRPCNVWPLASGGLAVADLTGRVAILDADDRPVLFLGDDAPDDLRATNRVGREDWRPGRFFAPHAVCADATGALYVMDWNREGRVSKLEPVAAK